MGIEPTSRDKGGRSLEAITLSLRPLRAKCVLPVELSTPRLRVELKK
jgi:hypothetical protein